MLQVLLWGVTVVLEAKAALPFLGSWLLLLVKYKENHRQARN